MVLKPTSIVSYSEFPVKFPDAFLHPVSKSLAARQTLRAHRHLLHKVISLVRERHLNILSGTSALLTRAQGGCLGFSVSLE